MKNANVIFIPNAKIKKIIEIIIFYLQIEI